MHRRLFLKSGACALLATAAAPRFLVRAADASPARGKVLVAVFQRGAVDGLSMVVPHGDPAYARERPSIALRPPRPGEPDGAVDLDGFFALHPALAPLVALWEARVLAVVHACSSPDRTRSHFDAQDYMESGTPGVKSTRDGWLNRCLHAREHREATPFRAVAVAPQLPRSLQGTAQALAVGQLGQFGIRARGEAESAMAASSFEREYAAAGDRALSRTGREAFEAIRLLKIADPAKYRPEHGASYPRSAYGEALRQIAQLVKADVGLEIAFAETGNWDHHVNEGGAAGQLANRLDDFARGLAAFTIDLGERMADVLVLTMSEFGRAVGENGNRGTDHGHGNAMLALGAGVRGGKVYGRWPGLEAAQRFEGRDLAVTTDFRDVFAEVAVRHLGIRDASVVFPGHRVEPGKFRGFLG